MDKTLSATGRTIVEWVNRLSGWLLLLAIIWLCWGLARIVWLLLAPPQAPNLPIVPMQIRQAPAINANAALSIFESVQQQAQSTQPPPNIKLSGVLLASPSSLSSAMLEVNSVMDNYRIGDELGDSGYILENVAWDEVVIKDRNNREIVVKLPPRMPLDQSELNKAKLAGTDTTAPSNGLRGLGGRSEPNNASTINNAESDKQAAAQSAENQQDQDNNQASAADPRSAIDSAVTQLKENSAGYLSNMGVMATGEGYQVTEAMPGKLRKRLGLQPGDKVLSVNGQNVGGNPAGDADLLNQVKQSGQATIEVQRGDQVLTVRQQF